MGSFKLDENLPTESAELLNRNGHDAVTVLDQQLGGQPDLVIAEVCQRERRVRITFDLDFADIRTFAPADYAGIIVMRVRSQDTLHLLLVLKRLIAALDVQPISGMLWIVDEWSIRIHG